MLYKRETERGNVVREGENKCGQLVVVLFPFLPLEKGAKLVGWLLLLSAPQDLVVVKRRLYRHWQAAGRPPTYGLQRHK